MKSFTTIQHLSFGFQPSFGYIITSPEKREPFALIHPSDFSNRDVSLHNDPTEVSETDKTLQPGVHIISNSKTLKNDNFSAFCHIHISEYFALMFPQLSNILSLQKTWTIHLRH